MGRQNSRVRLKAQFEVKQRQLSVAS